MTESLLSAVLEAIDVEYRRTKGPVCWVDICGGDREMEFAVDRLVRENSNILDRTWFHLGHAMKSYYLRAGRPVNTAHLSKDFE